MKTRLVYFLPGFLSFLSGSCEKGDLQYAAANSGKVLGLEEPRRESYGFRSGGSQFTGYFISTFDAGTAAFFTSLPGSTGAYPQPMSYEKGKTFVKWRQTPVAAEHVFLLKRANGAMEASGVPVGKRQAFVSLAERPGHYYAASYEDGGSGGLHDNLDFYLLEPGSRTLHEMVDTASFQ